MVQRRSCRGQLAPYAVAGDGVCTTVGIWGGGVVRSFFGSLEFVQSVDEVLGFLFEVMGTAVSSELIPNLCLD